MSVNGYKHESKRIAHTEEKELPGGWVVLKFGGTSVFVNLVEQEIKTERC